MITLRPVFALLFLVALSGCQTPFVDIDVNVGSGLRPPPNEPKLAPGCYWPPPWCLPKGGTSAQSALNPIEGAVVKKVESATIFHVEDSNENIYLIPVPGSSPINEGDKVKIIFGKTPSLEKVP